MVIRSTMPRKFSSEPMGSWMGTALARRRSRIMRHAAEEVGADAIHLVDEGDARHAVLVGLPPDGFRLRLDAADGAEHGDGAIEDAQRAFHLDREVDVARGIDDVDAVVAPIAGGRRRRDGDAAFLLLDHPVHGGGALMHLTDLIVDAGVVENALGRRRLTGIDVRHDADIASPFERYFASHSYSDARRGQLSGHRALPHFSCAYHR